MTMSRIRTFTIGGVNVGDGVSDPTKPEDDQLAFYKVTEITLEKKLLQPNELRFTLRRDKVGKAAETIQFNIAEDLLSKSVDCTIETSLKGMSPTQNEDFKVRFEGIVVYATLDGLTINCVALSKDYELSLIPHCRCFINKTLKEIVESIYTDVKRKVNPHNNDHIPYLVQYNETDYDFLVRLAKRFGEFLYFDQVHGLVFGKLPSDPLLDLYRRDDFGSIQYELTSGEPNHAYVTNHYQKEGVFPAHLQDYPAPGNGNGSNLYDLSKNVSSALKASIDLYYDYPGLLPFNADNTSLDGPAKLWSNSEAAGFVVCRCTTYRPDLYVGLKVLLCEKIGKAKYANGNFVITSTCLSLDCNGSPVNEITAMAISDKNNDNIFPPYLDVNAYPRSSAQRAIVVDNVDPLKLGRVMVRFAWMDVGKPNYSAPDAERNDYPWIRIAQPYGGNNKGCFILPEINEEVMVGFEHDNMEKPFVIGSLYNKVQGQEQCPDEKWCEVKDQDPNKGNEVKAFRTKKGHTIEIHDTDQGVGFIRIYNHDMTAPPGQDPQNRPSYDIILSTNPIKNGNDNYKVKGPKKVKSAEKSKYELQDYELSKLHVMVKSYGGDIVLDAGEGDIVMNAKNIRIHATEDRTTFIEGDDATKIGEKQLTIAKNSTLSVEENRYVYVEKKDYLSSSDYTREIKENVLITSKMLAAKANQKMDLKASTLLMNAQSNLEIESDASFKIKSKVLEEEADSTTIKGKDLKLDGKATTSVTGTNTTVEGKATMNLKTSKGGRTGNWSDGAV